MDPSGEARQIETFFKLAFGTSEGYVCIALLSLGEGRNRRMTELFFQYPQELDSITDAVIRGRIDSNVYYCAQLLDKKERRKHSVKTCPAVWADLDTCEPEKLLVRPTLLIESSPGRYQALWRMAEPLPPHEAEEISRNIAYYHAADGADRSGHDLTQLLRVPVTPNFKYSGEPFVRLIEIHKAFYTPTDFEVYPVAERPAYLSIPMPQMPKTSADEILDKYSRHLLPTAKVVFATVPEDNTWSEQLWKLEMLLFEAGMEREEVFKVAWESSCNKYKRDGKTPDLLWNEVLKAEAKYHENYDAIVMPGAPMVQLLSEDEERRATTQTGFVERYIEWASGLGDAAPQYHQAGAFIILSALLSGRVVLPTSYGNIIPNLWFMILGDTTLTRKSTSMDIAMDLVEEVDQDTLLATDGSVEGLLQGLETRPRTPSIFLRDEFSGLLEMMSKRDYYAGMGEVLTKLYDGKTQKRVLRKETVTVKDPILIIFAGGIKNRVQGLLTHEHVSSGFVPRFVFVTAESDTSRLQPLGPPTVRVTNNKEFLVRELQEMRDHYGTPRAVHVKELGQRITDSVRFEAKLDPKAWERYNQLEHQLLEAGLQTEKPDLMTPLFDRLAKSTLKAAVLLSAARQRGDYVEVTELDILHAIRYCQSWYAFAVEIVSGIGKNQWERDLEKILAYIARKPGVSRSQVMQQYHLSATQATQIFDTLRQRGQITVIRHGSGREAFYPLPGVAKR